MKLGVLRAVACMAALVAAALWLPLRSAEARLGEALRGFGAELVAWQEARWHSAPRRLAVNGLELGLVTASMPGSVPEALDRFHAVCRARGGLAVPEALRGHLPLGLDGTFRSDSDEEGVLACLDTGEPLELAELSGRLDRFAETGDLSAFGELRFVVARRQGDATAVLVLWTEGPAPLLEMFPEAGDAPGRDPEGVPRPEGARRVLSAVEQGMPCSLTVYETSALAPAELLAWYGATLKSGGWRISPGSDGHALAAARGTRSLVLRVAPGEGPGSAVVTVAEL